jgi:hypothetical protein
MEHNLFFYPQQKIKKNSLEDYTNPYGYQPEIPEWESMNEKEREEVTRKHILCGCLCYPLALALALLLSFLLFGCATKAPTVTTETHTVHHWHTDTVRQTDSIIDRQTTLIREVDSATMAQYGIQLKSMQRAWLVESDRLQRELSRLRESKADTVVIRDSIPYPVEVVKEKVKPLAWWQTALMVIGAIATLVFLLRIFNAIKKQKQL